MAQQGTIRKALRERHLSAPGAGEPAVKVAILGATGFVGSYIVDALIEAGHTPRALVRPGSEAKLRQRDRCEIVPGDAGDAGAVARLMNGRTCITITHDARTACRADRIFTIRDGQIVEIPPEEVMAGTAGDEELAPLRLEGVGS